MNQPNPPSPWAPPAPPSYAPPPLPPAPFNPYAAPAAGAYGGPGTLDLAEAERLRHLHLIHETRIKAIGRLHYLSFGVCVFALFVVLAFGIYLLFQGKTDQQAAGGVLALFGMVLYGALAAMSFVIGRTLVNFRSGGGLTLAIVFSAIGLLGFPLGTLLNGWILWLLLSEKGKFIFSPIYQEVLAKTPHIQYRVPLVTWIVLGLLVLGFVAMIYVLSQA